jgi:hypothetical protein
LEINAIAGQYIFLYSIFMSRPISSTEKRSRGRPKTNPTSIHVTLIPSSLNALDVWITEQENRQPSRPEAIRRLVELGVKAKRRSKP